MGGGATNNDDPWYIYFSMAKETPQKMTKRIWYKLKLTMTDQAEEEAVVVSFHYYHLNSYPPWPDSNHHQEEEVAVEDY